MAYADPELDLRVDRHGDVPVGAQLAALLRRAMRSGRLAPGERLPSVRELAAAAGVNVNTVRAMYHRLEHEGLVRSEHGRGTFVAGPDSDEAASREELRRQIAELEARLARLPPPPGDPFARPPAPQGGRLMTVAELRSVRDDLVERLRGLDAERTDILRTLAELDRAEAGSSAPEVGEGTQEAPRRSTLSLPGARVRWVGA